jgi:hypothetical protein
MHGARLFVEDRVKVHRGANNEKSPDVSLQFYVYVLLTTVYCRALEPADTRMQNELHK